MTSEQNKGTNKVIQLDEKSHGIDLYFDAVFNNLEDPIFVKDKQCRFVLVNNAFCNTFRLSKNDIIGKKTIRILTQSERDIFLSTDKYVLEKGTEIIGEQSLSLSGMQAKTFHITKSRFIDFKGSYFLVGVIHDITEKRRLEQEKDDAKEEKGKREDELVIAKAEKGKREDELDIAKAEKGKREDELDIAKAEKGKREDELDIAKEEKGKREDELDIAKAEKGKREDELDIAKEEKGKREDELVIANKELAFQNVEKDKRANELITANHKLALKNEENEYLLKKLKRAASVFTSADESIMITDVNGVIIEVNAAFSRITGYDSVEVLGKHPIFLQSKCHPPEFYTEMQDELLIKGHWRGERWSLRKNGEIYPEMVTVSTVKSASGDLQHFIYLSTDITELKAYQGQLENIAHYDMLTNLPNRVLLADRLSQAMLHCQRRNRLLVVAFMDLDGFKEVNDKHGHDVGDKLLITLSQHMKDALREGDTLARIGGDEFIAIMVDLEKSEDSAPVLERILKAVSETTNVDDAVLKVSVSIGVSLYPQDGVDADQLIRHADQAMYVAKQAGKNRYRLFDNELANAVKIQLESIHDIRSALEKCEFVLHYQPKVNMHTGKVIGVEALIRWQHHERGLILPLECLPVIEDKPISLELGEWVIDNALTQISQWQSMKINLPISINISAYQLQQDNFTTRLAALLAAHPEVNPSHLELEMLETSMLEDISKVSATMDACHKLGICFALDDFGTGYSSLTHLRRLPAKLIKIDQSFVRDMLEDPEDCAIVEGIIGLAKAFRRDVIAEGVETIAHGVALLQRGCEMAQGYGIARPMLADDIPKWLCNWKTKKSWSA